MFLFPQQETLAQQITNIFTVLVQKYIGLSKVSSKTAAKDIAKMIQEQDNEFGIGIRLMNSCIHQYFISKVNHE